MGLSIVPDITEIYTIPTVFTFTNDTDQLITISYNTTCPFNESPIVYIDYNTGPFSLLLSQPTKLNVSSFSSQTGLLESSNDYLINIGSIKPYVYIKNFSQVHYFVNSCVVILVSNTPNITVNITDISTGIVSTNVYSTINNECTLELSCSCKIELVVELDTISYKQYFCLKVASNEAIPYYTVYTDNNNTVINEFEQLINNGIVNLLGEFNSITNSFFLGQYSNTPFPFSYASSIFELSLDSYSFIPGHTKFYFRTNNLNIHNGSVRFVVYKAGDGILGEFLSVSYDTEDWFELSSNDSISIRLEWANPPLVISNTYVEIFCYSKRELLPTDVWINNFDTSYYTLQTIHRDSIYNRLLGELIYGYTYDKLVVGYRTYNDDYFPCATVDNSLPLYPNTLPIEDGYLQGYLDNAKLVHIADYAKNRQVLKQSINLHYNDSNGNNITKIVLLIILYTLYTENGIGTYLIGNNGSNFSDNGMFLNLYNNDGPKWEINGSLKAPYGMSYGYIYTDYATDFYFPKQLSITYKYYNPFGDVGNLTIYTGDYSNSINLKNGVYTQLFTDELYSNDIYIEYSYWVEDWQASQVVLEILSIGFIQYTGIVHGNNAGEGGY